MAFDTEAKILKAVGDKEKDSEVVALRKRFNDDYSLWRLTQYVLGKKGEYDNYTSNQPRNLVNRIAGKLASAPKQIRIPLEIDDEEERGRKSNAERLIYGCEVLANSRLQSIISPSLQEQMAFLATVRGWWATFVYLHTKKQGGPLIPDIKVWDMLNVTWDIGADNLLWVCNTRTISATQAKSEFGEKVRGETIKVRDFWEEEKNSIIVDKEFYKKPEKHGLDHIPILITQVGPVPFIQSEEHTDTLKDNGESVFASNRDIYEPKNKLLTELSTIIGQGAHNPLAISSQGGKRGFERSPYYKGSVVRLDVDKGEKVEALYKPEMPRQMNELLGAVLRDESMGGMPPIAAGELNFQLPYSGINLLIDAAQFAMLMPKTAIEKTYDWLGREILTQFAKGGLGKLKVHGRDGSNEAFDVELTADDIKGDWFPETKLLPVLPEDKPAQYAMAETAIRSGLLSPETARDKLIGIQDTDAEENKVLRHKASQFPPIMVMKMAKTLADDGRPDLAYVLMQMLYSEAGGGGGGGEEAIQPQFAPGMPNTAVTPEEMGRIQRPPGEREQFRGDKLRPLNI